MDLITAELTKKFKGQALAAAEGYAGSIDRLTVASNNAKEIIGKDLLDAMSMIAGKDGIGGATTAMEGFATQIGNAIYGIGVLTAKLNALPGGGFVTDVLSGKYGILGLLSEFGKSQKAPVGQASPGGAGSAAARLKYDKEQIKLQKTKNSLSKIDNDNTTRKLALTGDQLALLELEKQFDLERVELFAALNGNIDSETKMRVLSLIAIKDQNAALAGMIAKANLAGDALTAFKDAIVASIKALNDRVKAEIAALNAQFGGGAPKMPPPTSKMPPPTSIIPPGLGNPGDMGGGRDDWQRNRNMASSPTNIIINASGIGDQQIASVVQNAIQNLNRYGNSTTFAGAI
jgi:F0F1-type ATP synthase delta subunit